MQPLSYQPPDFGGNQPELPRVQPIAKQSPAIPIQIAIIVIIGLTAFLIVFLLSSVTKNLQTDNSNPQESSEGLASETEQAGEEEEEDMASEQEVTEVAERPKTAQVQPTIEEEPETTSSQEEIEKIELGINTEDPGNDEEEPDDNPGEPLPETPREDYVDRQYSHISQEIKNLANRLELTYEAKKELYDHNPQIFEDEQDEEYDCRTDADDIVVYGCWRVNNIDILRTASMETTIAHELLHAIYYDLYQHNETEEINRYLEEFKASRPEEIRDILELYEGHYDYENLETRQWAEYSELHSFIGTQFFEISEDLERHYAKYFNNRRKLVEFYVDWQESFNLKQSEYQAITGYVHDQDVQYQKCFYNFNNSVENCQAFKTDREAYEAYGECLRTHLRKFDDCLSLKPEFLPYELN